MGGFAALFDVGVDEIAPTSGVVVTRRKTPTKKKVIPRGCDVCPLNKVKGVRKIMGTMHGRDILVVAQSPGPDENKSGKELIGSSGKLWWRELRRVGIERKDVDIQNVVRCLPADRVTNNWGRYLKMRAPTRAEISACSIHTDDAMAQSKAKQILVLGQVAAKALLGARSLPQQKIFWSEKLKARIYLLDHPSFFVRGYGAGARFENFQRVLEQAAQDRKHSGKQLADRFSFIRKQHYELVVNRTQADAAAKIIRETAAKGRRVSFDIEHFKDKQTGARVMACIGFCSKPGTSYIFVTHHRDVPSADSVEVQAVAKALLEDSKIRHAAHYGCTDVAGCKSIVGIEVAGFDHDTLFSEYLRFSDKKKYGLDELQQTRFPEFSGYSMVIVKDMLDGIELPPAVHDGGLEAQYKFLNDQGHFDIEKLSLENLRLYNGADCDLCKRLELDNKKEVPQALMQLYVDFSTVLMEMEPNGPLFDFEQNEALLTVYPPKVDGLLKRLRKMLKWPEYNPRSTDQVKRALYEKRRLEYPFEGKPNTKKMTLLMLARKDPFPQVQLDYRGAARVVSTLEGYKFCAEYNQGQLITSWRGTGTRTGRVSSGGDKGKAKKKKRINLQNIKKNAQVQNVCIADRRWREVYAVIRGILKRIPDRKLAAAAVEAWVREHAPDLMTFLLLDYGQVEVRVAAQLARDANLIKDCGAADIHTTVGSVMTGWDAIKIKSDNAIRTLTKNVHFGILFGISRANLFKFVQAMSPADQRDRVTETQVSDAFDKYFERYPGIARFIVVQREFAREHKYVETMFGMRQVLNVTDDGEMEEDEDFEEIDDELEGARKSYWGNQAINGPVQGSAHQLLICALVNLVRRRKRYRVLGIPVMEVHDALYFRIPVLRILEAFRKAKFLLEHESLATVRSDFPKIKWKVPIVVEAEAGLRLGCKVGVDENTTPGSFLIEWFEKCRKQVIELKRELAAVV